MRLNIPNPPLQSFNVLAFDPGGTTGVAHAILRQDTININMEDFGRVTIGAIELSTTEMGPIDHHQELYEFIEMESYKAPEFDPPLEIVFEPFHFRQHLGQKDANGNPWPARHKVELISCEYIGIIKLACQQLGLTYYDRFVPGEAKRYCPNSKLETLGWLQTPITPMRHRNDALRQLVKYLIVKKKVRHPITTAWREN